MAASIGKKANNENVNMINRDVPMQAKVETSSGQRKLPFPRDRKEVI
jgi:hypothetical protein